jgi:hypothetical protein
MFLSIFKQRSIDMELQRFSSSVSANSKLNYYSVFKQDIICEKYLFVIQNLILRILLSKLRIGMLNLEINLGRYEGVPREERLCKVCNSGLIEDEFHFVLVCNYYVPERQRLIPQYCCLYPSISKFNQLMQSSNKYILNNLGKFLLLACKKRDMFFSEL